MPQRRIDLLNRQRVKQPSGAAARRFKQPRRMAFSLQNIMALPDGRPGVYLFFDEDGKFLYNGSGAERGVKARLIDVWYRRGDYHTDPVKKELREKIAKVDIVWGKNVFDNRELEAQLKKNGPYNRR